MKDYFLIAEIISLHNIDGFVLARSISDFPERFVKLEKVYIDFFGNKKEIFVEKIKKVKNLYAVKFKNFEKSDDVQFLIGKSLFVDSENLHKLPDDSFYIHDLIGSEVYKDTLFFGKLVDVLVLPANDVYVIERPGKENLLLPAVKKFIRNFDSENKRLYLTSDSDIFEDEN